jgi:hypothetical protein
MVGAGLEVIDWFAVAGELGDGGWVRLRAAVNEEARTVLTEAAPPTWSLLPEIEGRVRQGGWSSGVFFDHAVLSVQEFGRNICEELNAGARHLPAVPLFNEVQWGRSQEGMGFITAHRDPPAAGGIIAIVTLTGRARCFASGAVT